MGQSNHYLYSTWRGILDRCIKKNSQAYPDYGGRGIQVCQRWIESFDNFLADVGERPEGCSLDRIDVNGNYEPGNVRWAAVEVQAINTRRQEPGYVRPEKIEPDKPQTALEKAMADYYSLCLLYTSDAADERLV